MSYESYPQHSKSQTEEEKELISQLRGIEEQKELISQLRGIRITLIVGLIVLVIALAPWWLLGMEVLMQEAGTGRD